MNEHALAHVISVLAVGSRYQCTGRGRYMDTWRDDQNFCCARKVEIKTRAWSWTREEKLSR